MNNDDFQTISQLLDQKLNSSEERVKKHTEISVKQLSSDVGDFIAENLFPMIEEKADKSDIERLESNMERMESNMERMERKLDRVLDTSVEQGSRIKAIEQIPVVAHELKLRKSK